MIIARNQSTDTVLWRGLSSSSAPNLSLESHVSSCQMQPEARNSTTMACDILAETSRSPSSALSPLRASVPLQYTAWATVLLTVWFPVWMKGCFIRRWHRGSGFWEHLQFVALLSLSDVASPGAGISCFLFYMCFFIPLKPLSLRIWAREFSVLEGTSELLTPITPTFVYCPSHYCLCVAGAVVNTQGSQHANFWYHYLSNSHKLISYSAWVSSPIK